MTLYGILKQAAEAGVASVNPPVTYTTPDKPQTHTYRSVLSSMYDKPGQPSKADQYIEQARAYQKAHPEINFGYDINQVDTPHKAYWQEDKPTEVGHYNPFTGNISLSKSRANSAQVAVHEYMHPMSMGLMFPHKITGDTDTLIKHFDFKPYPKGTPDAIKKVEIAPVLAQVKNEARSLGYPLNTPEEVHQYFKGIRGEAPALSTPVKSWRDIQNEYDKGLMKLIPLSTNAFTRLSDPADHVLHGIQHLFGTDHVGADEIDEYIEDQHHNLRKQRMKQERLNRRDSDIRKVYPNPRLPGYLMDYSKEVEDFMAPLLPGYTHYQNAARQALAPS